jgi:hypothetical protein
VPSYVIAEEDRGDANSGARSYAVSRLHSGARLSACTPSRLQLALRLRSPAVYRIPLAQRRSLVSSYAVWSPARPTTVLARTPSRGYDTATTSPACTAALACQLVRRLVSSSLYATVLACRLVRRIAFSSHYDCAHSSARALYRLQHAQ